MSQLPLENEVWNSDDLEPVDTCPFCQSTERSLAHHGVRDWCFYAAPGAWDFYECRRCQCIYLDPRPTASSIGRAYANYYTHEQPSSLAARIKDRLKNEVYSELLGLDVRPRMVPSKLVQKLVTKFLGASVSKPFGFELLGSLPKGKFLDVGCGSGVIVRFARSLGWDAMGIDMDPVAVGKAQAIGLNVVQGSPADIPKYGQEFDCIMCCHVLEHVHDPIAMLKILKSALKPCGTLFLVLPNSQSGLRAHFSENWRGLEAPRHLQIPSQQGLTSLLAALGFKVKVVYDPSAPTAAESLRIQRRDRVVNDDDLSRAAALGDSLTKDPNRGNFIGLYLTL
ncbi:MAG: class I SAM-dependent methyltransferase [Deltaproteobacteria bacterium]|nr:class I SAM-dependent methyltransferase [Deltaproteobacteria bacterium]